MKNFTLTTEQVSALRVAHRAERNRHAAYKINAVILLGTGWKLKDVKAALLLDDETLRSYVEKYMADGIDGLVSVHLQGRACLLTEEQQEALCLQLERVWRYFKKQVLYSKCYDDIKIFRVACVDFFQSINQNP